MIEVKKYLWDMSFKESIFSAFLGTLIALSKLIRIPIHVPGHSGLIWIAILTFGCLLIRKKGSGTLMGVTAGFLAYVFGIGNEGPFVFFKYFMPGFSMDIILRYIPTVTKKWYLVSLVAAFSHITKLMVNYAIGTILNLPQGYLLMGMQIAVINHAAFGFLGGMIAYIIYIKNPNLTTTNYIKG
ncbi:MAG: hypothetical protein LIR50_06545 [Bacillota bacterium]|nr:hypothetical protein [Bacillota bacterium]